MTRKSVVVAAVAVIGLFSCATATRSLARSRTSQLFGTLISRVETRDSVVALSFDDGPVERVTPEILDALRSRGVHATFFVIGADLERAPAAGRSIVENGHELGNHSYSHARLVLVAPSTVRREVVATDSLIRASGFDRPILFRPPYGYKLVTLPLFLSRASRTTVTWDIEPDSYADVAATAEGIVRHVLDRARPGSIILLHPWYSSRATSRHAIPMLVDSLHARGYQVGTVGELLAHAR